MNNQTPIAVSAVVIDLDGTLLDTVGDLTLALTRTFSELGLAPLGEDLVRTFVGKGIPHLVRRALTHACGGEPDEELIERALPLYFSSYESVNGTSSAVYPGVMQGLEVLREKGFPMACVTNKSARFAQPLLERMRIREYFSLVVGGDTVARKKPDPLPLTHTSRHFGIAPAQMLMVGDSVNDALAARAAGCPVFCVSYGYNEGTPVRDLDVDAIVDTMLEVTTLIVKS
jgi:phosphoglycolate phosphatase